MPTFKVFQGEDCRRFASRGAEPITVGWVLGRLSAATTGELGLSLSWTDEDGDAVSIVDDADLQEAVQSAAVRGGPEAAVRLIASAVAAPSSAPPAPPPAPPQAAASTSSNTAPPPVAASPAAKLVPPPASSGLYPPLGETRHERNPAALPEEPVQQVRFRGRGRPAAAPATPAAAKPAAANPASPAATMHAGEQVAAAEEAEEESDPLLRRCEAGGRAKAGRCGGDGVVGRCCPLMPLMMMVTAAVLFGIGGSIKIAAVAGLGCWAFRTLPAGTQAKAELLFRQRCELSKELARHPPAVITGLAVIWLIVGLCAVFKVGLVLLLTSPWRRATPALMQRHHDHHHRQGQSSTPAATAAALGGGDTALPGAPLGLGSYGPGVEQLQRFLIERDLMPEGAIRWRAGVLGPQTAAALERFQRATGLPAPASPAEVYNEATRSRLFDFARPGRTTVAATGAGQQTPHQPWAGAGAGAGDAGAAAAAAAPRIVAGQQRWARELSALEAMGFEASAAVVALLNQSHGSLDTVIGELVR